MTKFDRQQSSEEHDAVQVDAVRRMRASICVEWPEPCDGQPAPLLAHWLCFLPATPLNKLGDDGHPSRPAASLLIDLPRRMWAGSKIDFHRPLRIGAVLMRRSTIGEPSEKIGRGGRIALSRLEHEIRDSDGVVVRELHNIVYRAAAQPGDALPKMHAAPAAREWTKHFDPDPFMPFRYSALTFNSHRIHYDRNYAIERESYPGLVVHGPLAATLLLHELLARHPGIDVATYSFRALRPMFDGAPFFACGSLAPTGVAHFFARDTSGVLCIDATATLRETS